MDETSGPTSSAKKHPKQILGADFSVVTVTALVTFVLVLGIFTWAVSDVILSTGPSGPVEQTLTLAGFLLTGGALVIALLIFQFQKQSSHQQHEELIRKLSPRVLREDIDTVDAATEDAEEPGDETVAESNEVEAGSSAGQAVPTEELIAMGVDPAQAARYDVFDQGKVPIHVLAGLFSGWKELQDAGELPKNWGISGWEADEAVAYRLKPGTGKGNHRWFVRMTNRDNPQVTHLWQVSPGGRGRTSPKVKRLTSKRGSASRN